MRLLLIRHGDPDYEADSLTPKGWREAELLAERMANIDIKNIYVSPLGRAKDTASLTLQKIGMEAQECEWLREFAPRIKRPDRTGDAISWDWLPQDWTAIPEFYDKDAWKDEARMKEGKVGEEYAWVTGCFDSLLAKHGYMRKDNYYQVVHGNEDTIVFFCHFGVTCVLLSHLLGTSPMILWHGTCAAPTSVTTIVTEERRQSIASFRMGSFGDVNHLLAAGEQPSFSARFCERFENTNERHD